MEHTFVYEFEMRGSDYEWEHEVDLDEYLYDYLSVGVATKSEEYKKGALEQLENVFREIPDLGEMLYENDEFLDWVKERAEDDAREAFEDWFIDEYGEDEEYFDQEKAEDEYADYYCDTAWERE